jgi:hypothetical protein
MITFEDVLVEKEKGSLASSRHYHLPQHYDYEMSGFWVGMDIDWEESVRIEPLLFLQMATGAVSLEGKKSIAEMCFHPSL